MSANEAQERIARWLLRIGKERATAWSMVVRLRNEDPFTNMLWKAFLSTNLGDSFATAKIEEIKRRASRAESVFDFLNRRYEEGDLEKLMEELGPEFRKGIGRRMIDAVKRLIELEREFNVRSGALDKDAMNRLYEQLKSGKVPGIGDLLAHHIIYDLIRLFGFPVPDKLGPPAKLVERLRLLGFKEPEKVFRPEDWPYVDIAVWDL